MKLIRDDDSPAEAGSLTAEEEALASSICKLHRLCERLDETLEILDRVPGELAAAARSRLMLDDDREECRTMAIESATQVAAIRDRAALLTPMACTVIARVDVTQTMWCG